MHVLKQSTTISGLFRLIRKEVDLESMVIHVGLEHENELK